MRKRPLFALGMCAAALLGQVSPGQRSTPQTQPSSQKPQAVPPSAQTGNQNTARQNPQRANQASGPNAQAAAPSPQAGKQAAGQKGQAAPSPQTGTPASALKAQAARPPVIPPGFRLLALREGRAMVQGMAWADDEEGLAPDCSHLVHTLYLQAGYPYSYASSLDLYRGTGPFLRVRYPHPGDLVVWRGHAGIVVNPREHSFFSTTSSGARIQSYRSAYWRARGYPHFFRYLTKTPLQAGARAAEAANRPPEH